MPLELELCKGGTRVFLIHVRYTEEREAWWKEVKVRWREVKSSEYEGELITREALWNALMSEGLPAGVRGPCKVQGNRLCSFERVQVVRHVYDY